MNIKGVGIGRGVAVGPVIRMAAPLPEPSDAPRAESISAETEIARVEKSLALVNADLNRRAEEAANGDEGAKQAAPILQAIAMFASDPSLAQSIKDLINQGKTAERAVLEGFGAVEDMFRAIGGYQAERAADLHDVGQRVIADLMGAPAPGLPVSETPFVLVAEDLSPADTAELDMSKTLAIVTSQGGPTSHTAILARARGIVAVVSAAEAAELENGTNVIVNAAKGEIVVNPSEDEIAAAEAELSALGAELQRMLLPKDPDDARPAFMEIRAGTGGDESALFAGDLARMYTRYAATQGWRVEVMSESPAELGGYKEVVLRIEGDGVYGQMRFESGGHRVQRVPVTETQGRIHTSAATVAVMPEPDAAEVITLNPADLRIDTFRASGAGGQHINKTDSAVRVVHLPTGIVAECQDGRSQHANKAKALQVLQARLQEKERSERAAKEAATRKGLIGSGDRSDRIRTYNFPQGRLTDHRINLTLYKLALVMEGDLSDVIDALRAAREAEQMAELEGAG